MTTVQMVPSNSPGPGNATIQQLRAPTSAALPKPRENVDDARPIMLRASQQVHRALRSRAFGWN
jgi:hypothetical protein